MKLSRRVARFNSTINNRVQGVYAWLLPPWAIILHRGRRSGRSYRTPVLAFRRDQTLIIALLYGEESDWLRNLYAGAGQVVRGVEPSR
jgi:deazaflavin-dependent oxidoreductase (nitroreductase family)